MPLFSGLLCELLCCSLLPSEAQFHLNTGNQSAETTSGSVRSQDHFWYDVTTQWRSLDQWWGVREPFPLPVCADPTLAHGTILPQCVAGWAGA